MELLVLVLQQGLLLTQLGSQELLSLLLVLLGHSLLSLCKLQFGSRGQLGCLCNTGLRWHLRLGGGAKGHCTVPGRVLNRRTGPGRVPIEAAH